MKCSLLNQIFQIFFKRLDNDYDDGYTTRRGSQVSVGELRPLACNFNVIHKESND